jgi:hypothetical protein
VPSEEQIIGFLREAEAGVAVAELCRRHEFSEPVVRAMERLLARGPPRHDALHAVALFVAEHLFEAMTSAEFDVGASAARFNAEVERLTDEQWLRREEQCLPLAMRQNRGRERPLCDVGLIVCSSGQG